MLLLSSAMEKESLKSHTNLHSNSGSASDKQRNLGLVT